MDLLELVVNHLELVCQSYPSLEWTHVISSPHQPDSLISLEVCVDDWLKPPELRNLVCPSTNKIINSEDLLDKGGVVRGLSRLEVKPWWWIESEDNHGDNWILHQLNLKLSQKEQIESELQQSLDPSNHRNFIPLFQAPSFSKFKVLIENASSLTAPIPSEESKNGNKMTVIDRLKYIWTHLGGDFKMIRKAKVIHHPHLLTMFGNLYTYWSETLSKKGNFTDDWRSLEKGMIREEYLKFFDNFSRQFNSSQWNDPTKIQVLPLIQGTNEEEVNKIMTQGYSLSHYSRGLFQKGNSFTTLVDYASRFAQDDGQGKMFLISCVLTGYIFPSAEQIDALYDSVSFPNHYHSTYSLVERNNGQPIGRELNPETDSDKLTVYEKYQALPLFVVYV